MPPLKTAASLLNAKHYRDRAEEMLVLAEQTTDLTARRALIRSAAEWEVMALRAEQRWEEKAS